jgi:hypothetical protein
MRRWKSEANIFYACTDADTSLQEKQRWHMTRFSQTDAESSEYWKYTCQDNMRHHGDKPTPIVSTTKLRQHAHMGLNITRHDAVPTPGVAMPVIPTPIKFNKYGFKTTCDKTLVNRTRASQLLSCVCGHRIINGPKRVLGTHFDTTTLSGRWVLRGC